MTAVHTVKNKLKFSQNFMAFSEYKNFKLVSENEYHFMFYIWVGLHAIKIQIQSSVTIMCRNDELSWLFTNRLSATR